MAWAAILVAKLRAREVSRNSENLRNLERKDILLKKQR
jgi:hypothetical protein